MIHTNFPRNCVVFLFLCELTVTRSVIKWPTVLVDKVKGGFPFTKRTNMVGHSHKWPTVLVDEVKGKPRNFELYLCGSLYSTF